MRNKRPVTSERGGSRRISEDEGKAPLIEAMILFSVVTIMAIVLGFTVGIPLASMLRDTCASLKC
jgi:hypothetical protein